MSTLTVATVFAVSSAVSGTVELRSARERIDVGTWLNNLQYREVHAVVWGFGLAAGSGVGLAVAPTLGTTIITAALVLLGWAFTGRWSLDMELRRSGLDLADEEATSLPEPPINAVLRQVAHEPHYYIGGLTAGALVGAFADAILGAVVA